MSWCFVKSELEVEDGFPACKQQIENTTHALCRLRGITNLSGPIIDEHCHPSKGGPRLAQPHQLLISHNSKMEVSHSISGSKHEIILIL